MNLHSYKAGARVAHNVNGPATVTAVGVNFVEIECEHGVAMIAFVDELAPRQGAGVCQARTGAGIRHARFDRQGRLVRALNVRSSAPLESWREDRHAFLFGAEE